MRLSVVLIFITVLQVSATLYSQNTRLNLTVDETSVRDVLRIIENQSNFRFFYSDGLRDLDRKVSCSAEDATIENVLSKILTQGAISYQILENDIVVITPFSNSQKIKISGRVTDANTGDPMPGVNVLYTGTQIGTTTNTEGNYSLEVPGTEGQLSFSFIGYISENIPIGNQNTIDIALIPDIKTLEEVVVVGYGIQKKINLTGSVESVKMEQISGRTGSNISNVMAGQVAGLVVTQTSGQPGNDGGILHIRGIGTIRGDLSSVEDYQTAPMYIVDGVESDMSQVPVDDIESISVLKDAASAAIYGVRAANGVVLITTKRGKTGKTNFSYNSYAGFQRTTRLPEFLGSADFATLYNEAQINDNSGATPKFSEEDIAKFRDGSDPDNYASTDWLGALFADHAMKYNHYLSMTGGNEKTMYALSLNYLQQDGLTPNTSYKRYSLRTNFDHQVNRNLKIGLNLSYTFDKTTEPSLGLNSIINYNYREAPTVPVRFSNGNWSAYLNEHNSVAMATDGGAQISTGKTFFGTLNTEYQITKDLSFKTTTSLSDDNSDYDQFCKVFSIYSAPTVLGKTYRSYLGTKRAEGLVLDFTSLLNYKKVFNKHAVSGLIGFNTKKSDYTAIYANVYDLPSNNSLDQLDAGDATTATNYGNDTEYRLLSLFGRLNYSFKDRYLFEANLRYDGSSRFPESDRFAYFPSFSVGWRVSEEEFMKSIEAISNLKIRASWGQLGNQNIGNYAYQSTYSIGSIYSYGSTQYSGITESSPIANSEITWEIVTMKNIGIDLGLWNGKLNFTGDYYINNTRNILLELPQPAVLGSYVPTVNAGKVLNRGIDLSLKFQDNVGDMNYFISANFGYNHNEITDLKGADTPGRSVGDPIYNLYGYKTAGLFQSDEEIANAPVQTATNGGNTPVPGDIRYVDLTGDNIVNSDDRTSLGSFFPKINYGGQAGFDYKSFDFSITLQGVAKVKRQLASRPTFAFINGGKVLKEHMDRWTPSNTDASYPRISLRNVTYYINNPSSYWIKDASFLKCRNIQVGYSLPSAVVEKLKIVDRFRIYISADNVFVITPFKDYDPEIPNGTTAIYPQTRTIVAGFNINF